MKHAKEYSQQAPECLSYRQQLSLGDVDADLCGMRPGTMASPILCSSPHELHAAAGCCRSHSEASSSMSLFGFGRLAEQILRAAQGIEQAAAQRPH